jgi:hypothetical protein
MQMNMKLKSALLLPLMAGITLTSYGQKAVPNGWHLGSETTTGYYGIGLDKAYDFLKERKARQLL